MLIMAISNSISVASNAIATCTGSDFVTIATRYTPCLQEESANEANKHTDNKRHYILNRYYAVILDYYAKVSMT
jgi:hypothetical protein